MSSEGVTVEELGQALPERVTNRAGSRVRLSPGERRFMLLVGDLFLINTMLVLSITVWNEFDFSIGSVVATYKWFVTLALLWYAIATVLNMYDLAAAASTSTIVGRAGLAALLTTLIYVLVPWLTPPIINRSYIFGFAVLGILSIVGWRTLYARALVHPNFRRRALIIGTGTNACSLTRELVEAGRGQDANPYRGTGYEVIGMVAEAPGGQAEPSAGVAVLGDVTQLVSLARLMNIDEVVVALEDMLSLSTEGYESLLDCRELGLQVSSQAAVLERLTARLPVAYASHDPAIILEPSDNTAERLFLAAKRLVDVLFSLAGLVFLGIIAPWVALGDALLSPGPLFYRQVRVGKGGRPFMVIKFRSMCVDAEADTGAVWSGDGDARITPIGRWLRRVRLDELPQVVNVLRGEMSVVGPRPERPQFVGALSHELPLYRARHAVKPGITGWAQIHYGYGNSVEDARLKLEYDLYYIKHASVYLDVITILHTIAVILQFRGR